jgi:hypothetical protein
MPSFEYYRRQAETLLSLASSTKDPSLSALCQSLAAEYKQLAERPAGRKAPEPPAQTSPLPSTPDSV